MKSNSWISNNPPEQVPMRQQIEARLKDLRSEYEKGQTQLRQLETQLTSVRETLMRISGAIMVLEEVLASPSSTTTTEEQRSADLAPGEYPAVQGRWEPQMRPQEKFQTGDRSHW